jgi:hypothetical protein
MLTLRACSLLSNLQHLSIDVEHSHSSLLLLLLLLLAWLLLWLLRLRLPLLRLLPLYLLSCLNSTQHTKCHITSATCHIQVLHACKRRQGLYQPASSGIKHGSMYLELMCALKHAQLRVQHGFAPGRARRRTPLQMQMLSLLPHCSAAGK